MDKLMSKRLIAVFLAALMMLTALPVISFAAEEDEAPTADAVALAAEENGQDGLRSAEEVLALISADPYADYIAEYSDVPVAKDEIVVYGKDYDKEMTDAAPLFTLEHEGVKDALYTPKEGKVTWTIEVPETGLYAMDLTYYPVSNEFTMEGYASEDVRGMRTVMERIIYIDGELPFSEARYLYFPRIFEYEYLGDGYRTFDSDMNGNDIRPIRNEVPDWFTYYVRDWLGFTMEPFQFYLTRGTHTITIEATREPMIVEKFVLYPYETSIGYDEYLAEMKAQGVKEITDLEEPIVIQMEQPDLISHQNICPANDRTSALSMPQDPAVVKYNYVDAATVGNWMRYTVEVPESGLYKISARFRQNVLLGMYTSRRIRINGEIPFEEASFLRFNYDTSWQCKQLNDGDKEFLFYLEKGQNTIEFETVLGSMADYVYTIKNSVMELEDIYRNILTIIGTTPDPQRDYGFARLMPGTLQNLANQAEIILNVKDEIYAQTGLNGDQIQALDTIGTLLRDMARDEYLIAENFTTFKQYIVSLTGWMYSQLGQNLKFDCIYVQNADEEAPRAVANFFEAAWFELRAFIGSFSMDYTTIGFTYEDGGPEYTREITMWASTERETMLIRRRWIDETFTPETGIRVNLKIFSAGLQESILAGVGPDVSTMAPNDAITWGLRNAVYSIQDMEGFDDVYGLVHPELWKQLTIDGGETYYGYPVGMSFKMMFYRVDVLMENNLQVPKTWDELYGMLPTLLNKHLELGMPQDWGTFLYQQGGTLYADNDRDGRRTNLDTNLALSAFEDLCEFFTKYKCKTSYDTGRFRTGEIPIMFGEVISTYNTLMGMSDLRGLWEMAPMPGTVREDGTVSYLTTVDTAADIIPRGCKDIEAAWEYIKWSASTETTYNFGMETIAVTGPTTKFGTANLAVLGMQPWTDEEWAAIEHQLDNLVAIPNYPGNYIVTVHINNAFMEAYNGAADPAEALLDRIVDINTELNRKRKELGMDYYDVSMSGTLQDSE